MTIKHASVRVDQIATDAITYESFIRNLDEDVRAEWVDGLVVQMSPASTRHQRIGRFIIALISRYLEDRPVGELFYESFQMKTGPGLPGREPDVVFVTDENLHRLRDSYLDGPGDLVVEIVSLESESRDRIDKKREYAAGGVREYWLIDPIREQTYFYVLGDDGVYEIPDLDNGMFASRVVPGLRVDPSWFLQEPLPKIRSVEKQAGLGADDSGSGSA